MDVRPKMHGKPGQWCHCCTNERVLKVAEEIIEAAAQKYYISEMCIGSLADAFLIASEQLQYTNARKMIEVTGLPMEVVVVSTDARNGDILLSPDNVDAFGDMATRVSQALVTVRTMHQQDKDEAKVQKGD